MSKKRKEDYDDSYPTCVETYSTLRVFSDDLAGSEITRILQIQPTKVFQKGELHTHGQLQRKSNGWFYSTKSLSSSRDTRRHIDLILDRLDGKLDAVNALNQERCKVDIVSYWVSTGQGGPFLTSEQMLKLGTLGISVWWDIYFEERRKICTPCSSERVP